MTRIPGIDGLVPAGRLPAHACCPPSVCSIDDCSFICNFVQAALPDGPAWDAAKESYNAARPGDCGTRSGSFCSDLVGHAAFVAGVILGHIRGAIWPSVREASPFTAWTTRQAYLDRWGWSNCFLDPFRSGKLGALTPYELVALPGCETIEEQGAHDLVAQPPPSRVLSPPPIPQPLADAVMHGTVVALARRALGPIPTLASLNFIIAPLGAAVSAEEPFDVWAAVEARRVATCDLVDAVTGAATAGPAGLAVEPFEEQGTGEGFDPFWGPYRQYVRGASADCSAPPCPLADGDNQGQVPGGCPIFDVPLVLTIVPNADFIARFDEMACPMPAPAVAPNGAVGSSECVALECETIPAFIEPCDPARPARIYPGVLAAECIVRSILPDTLPYTLRRCAEPAHARPCA